MSVADLCQAILERSDNAAANLLLARIGGPQALTAYIRSLGDTITPHRPLRAHRWPLRRHGHDHPPRHPPPSPAPRSSAPPSCPHPAPLLRRWMQANAPGQTRLRAAFPATWTAADRTGTGDGICKRLRDRLASQPRSPGHRRLLRGSRHRPPVAGNRPARSRRSGRLLGLDRSKQFFFEKKNQKTLSPGHPATGAAYLNGVDPLLPVHRSQETDALRSASKLAENKPTTQQGSAPTARPSSPPQRHCPDVARPIYRHYDHAQQPPPPCALPSHRQRSPDKHPRPRRAAPTKAPAHEPPCRPLSRHPPTRHLARPAHPRPRQPRPRPARRLHRHDLRPPARLADAVRARLRRPGGPARPLRRRPGSPPGPFRPPRPAPQRPHRARPRHAAQRARLRPGRPLPAAWPACAPPSSSPAPVAAPSTRSPPPQSPRAYGTRRPRPRSAPTTSPATSAKPHSHPPYPSC